MFPNLGIGEMRLKLCPSTATELPCFKGTRSQSHICRNSLASTATCSTKTKLFALDVIWPHDSQTVWPRPTQRFKTKWLTRCKKLWKGAKKHSRWGVAGCMWPPRGARFNLLLSSLLVAGTGKKHRLKRGRGSAGFNHPQSAQCNGLRELAPVQHRCTFCLPLSSSGNFQHNTVHMQYPSDNLMFVLPPLLDTL